MSAVSDAGAVITDNAVPRNYSGTDMSAQVSSNYPTQQDFINIFGPAGADVKLDKNRFGRMNRVHIPDVLRGPNQWMTDRIDGLITDTTNSPYTTLILPYKYIETPDAKFKWNVWSFDEGLASRVPYESAARTLTQSKREFAGFTVRQGLAITMEHNFMMSPEGRQNFQNQLRQIVGSIQYTNDLDVHMALVNAPSYFLQVREKYYRDEYNLEKEIRDYVDSFGFLQKNMNGLDILIEDAKSIMRGWGAEEPDFMLLNSKLTFQITMMPEKTQYLTQGIDGVKRLREGPNITRYRGLNCIRSKAFSMEQGAAPRDLMRRRVRVAEFYLVPIKSDNNVLPDDVKDGSVELFDESSDSWCSLDYKTLHEECQAFQKHYKSIAKTEQKYGSVLIIRPNIEHYMLGLIIGKGGLDELGATLWGQTELSCFDDGQHGIWGMSYKYHEKVSFFVNSSAPVFESDMLTLIQAIVFNERNLIRLWDVAYDGYVGGKDMSLFRWSTWRDNDTTAFENEKANWRKNDSILTTPYTGASILIIPIQYTESLPSPLPLTNLKRESTAHSMLTTAEIYVEDLEGMKSKIEGKVGRQVFESLKDGISHAWTTLGMGRNNMVDKAASAAATENESSCIRMAYSGSYRYKKAGNLPITEKQGCGHHGPDYPGVTSLRAGKGYRIVSQPMGARIV